MNKNYAIWLWLCILAEFCRIWIASSLFVFFMQCKLVYKSIICSIRFFDFNFQGAIGMAIPRFLFSFFASKSLSSFYLFWCFNFHRRGLNSSRQAQQNRSENRHSKNIQNASEVKKNS